MPSSRDFRGKAQEARERRRRAECEGPRVAVGPGGASTSTHERRRERKDKVIRHGVEISGCAKNGDAPVTCPRFAHDQPIL